MSRVVEGAQRSYRFSPLAGIRGLQQGVIAVTTDDVVSFSFSPLAGIRGLQQEEVPEAKATCSLCVSVP